MKLCLDRDGFTEKLKYFHDILMVASLFSTLVIIMIVASIPHASLLFPALAPILALWALRRQRSGKMETLRLEREMDSFVEVLSRLITARDPHTMRHTERVKEYAVVVARQAGSPADEIKKVARAARLHDIGKILVKEQVLRKKSALTLKEFEHIKTHVMLDGILGPLLSSGNPLAEVLQIGRLHHERHDGMGYPFGLKGEEIPFATSIISVADAWDAMTAGRIYRAGIPEDQAVKILESGRGTQWNPKAVDAFMEAYRNGEIQKIGKVYQLWFVENQKKTLQKFEKILVSSA